MHLLACVWLAGGCAAAQTATAPAAPSEGDRHALLIGCTAYPKLRPRYQLRGPANDVALTTKLLLEHYGFVEDDIVALVHENDESMRPTHDNIYREFAALVDRVAAGDSVFILLGGHGSQQVNDDPNDPNDDERDGLDEVFLPEDVTEWRPGQPVVKAIRDDQIGEWLDALRDRGATVFFVADTCHSGTIDRAGEEEWDENSFYRERYVDPSIINPPGEDLSGHQAEGELTDTSEQDAARSAARGALISLFAVDDRTKEKEHPMPPDSRRDGPSYGRLSYALNWVLTRTRRPLSYRELAQQIRWRYQSWDWQDVGYVSGRSEELDREVLGDGMFQGRSTILLARDEYQQLSINVGLLHGATVGTIYVVYPPIGADGDDQPAGHVRVVEATPTTARVESCEYDSTPAVDAASLPAPGRCELAFAAHGDMRMTVAVEPLTAEFAVDAEDVAAIIGELADLPGSLLQLAADGEEPDAYVLVDDRGVFLRKSYDPSIELDSDSQDAAAEFPAGAFGPFPIEDGVGTDLARALETMAKAVNLRSLATSETEMIIGDPLDPAVRLEVQVARWDAATETYQDVDPLKPLDAYDGDKLRVRVYNRGRKESVDLTILYVESAFRIRSYFPTAMQDLSGGFNNRLAPERIPGDGVPAQVEFSINDSTIGLEDVIIIATVAERGAPQNFVFLEQPGLPTPRGDRGPGDPPEAVDTPLGQLLASLAYGRGDRGGNAAPDIAKYAVHRLSWTVRKVPVPP
jgi:hypothetical protein